MATYEDGKTAEQYLLEHKLQRNEFMTEDEIAEAELMLGWFREAWYFKDENGLFDRWDIIDSYWQGDANRPVYPDDIGSNTNIINPHVEGQVALSWQDPVAVYARPVDPSDTFYKKEAQSMLDFVFRENRVKSLRDNIYRRLKKEGVTANTVFWDPDCLDGKGMPKFRNWNIRYVYFDPAIIDPQDFPESRYVILQTFKTLQWAHEMFGEQKAAAITPGYHTIEGQWDLGGSGEWEDYERENTSYIHLYVLTKRNGDGKVRMIQMSGDGVVLDEKKLIDDQYPVFFCEQMRCEQHMYGMSTAYLLLSTQDGINDLDDQIRMNARMFGNPQRLVDSSSGIDTDSLTNESGLVITFNGDIDKAFGIVKPQAISGDVFTRRREMMYGERQIIGRMNDNMSGTAQQGIDTATEAAALQATGMAVIDTDKRKVQEMFAEMAKYALKLIEEYWDTEMAFRVTGQDDFVHIRPSKLKNIPVVAPASREYIEKATKQAIEDHKQTQMMQGIPVMDGELPPGFQPPKYMIYKDKSGKEVPRQSTFDIIIDFGADVARNKAFALSMAKEAYLAKVIDPTEYRCVLHDNGIIPYVDAEKEQQIVAEIKDMQKALLRKEEAAADATMMNAQANTQKAMAAGQAPAMQGMPGGTPLPGNPMASMPNAMIPGMTGAGRVANPVTQPGLSATGG